jgi:hypothetical protein
MSQYEILTEEPSMLTEKPKRFSSCQQIPEIWRVRKLGREIFIEGTFDAIKFKTRTYVVLGVTRASVLTCSGSYNILDSNIRIQELVFWFYQSQY